MIPGDCGCGLISFAGNGIGFLGRSVLGWVKRAGGIVNFDDAGIFKRHSSG
jgi:hypothetical protein